MRADRKITKRSQFPERPRLQVPSATLWIHSWAALPITNFASAGGGNSVPLISTVILTCVPPSGTVSVVIKSFVDKRTAALFAGYGVRGLPNQIQRRAKAKLVAVDAAKQIDDLRIPPGNRLESLHGDRRGQYSIRVNDQWRICFGWREGGAWEVEIVDYHKG